MAGREEAATRTSMPRGGSGSRIDSGPQRERIQDADEAMGLANHLLAPNRKLPVVVVTRASGAASAYVDLEEVSSSLAGLAHVVEITTTEASWAFSGQVPDMCQVYGGAARVYPIGDEWTRDPFLSPLRFAYGPSDKARITRQLVSDALSMAARGGLTVGSSAVAPRRVDAVVGGVVGDRALVHLQNGDVGVLWPELVEPGLPADLLFKKGMRITGAWDPSSRRIDLEADRIRPEEALSTYSDGSTVLARVLGVDHAGCELELFPGEVRRVGSEDLVDDGESVSSLVAPGDVVPVWIGKVEGEWLLSILDAAGPDEALPAPSILRGGPPWLVPQDLAPVERPQPIAVEASPADGDFADDPERALLVRRLRIAEQQITELEMQLRESRARLRDAEKRLKRRQTLVAGHDRLFEDEREQLDFEIRDLWARTTTPADKQSRPLRPWRYSPHFFDTLAQLEGVSRAKIVEVVVHVLTGLDTELASRERHQLRTGTGGDDPPLVRQGGDSAWRVSLQVNTPSARRLHYWMCGDGTIELSSLRLHDDYRV